MSFFPLSHLHFMDRLLKEGAQVYLVGGPVRDSLLKIPHKDHDLLVRKLEIPTLIGALKSLGRVNQVGKSFGIIKFHPSEAPDLEFDIALPRVEKSTGTGHRDFEVDFNPQLTVEEDLSRRDFTINAMAFDLEKQVLIDPFGGVRDLQSKILRHVFSKAFQEDPLRLLRGVQFAARFELTVEPETLASLKGNAPLIKTVSKERIIEEIRKLFLAEKPSLGFDLMRETGLLDFIFPFVTKMIGVIQPMKRNEDVYQHTMKVLDASRASQELEQPGNMEIMFAALLHDAGKPQTVRVDPVTQKTTFYGHQIVSARIARRWLNDYRASCIGLNVDQVLNLVANHMFETKHFYTDRAIRRFVSKVGQDSIFKLIDLRVADKKGGKFPKSVQGIMKLRERIKAEINKKSPFGPKDLALNGHDIIALGFKPGPLIGQIQKFLVDKALDEPELNEKEKLTDLIKKNFT